MHKRLIWFLVGLACGLELYGQESLTVRSVDSISYAMYQHGEWNDLIELARKAKKEQIEFYYLSVRLAEAYFYTNRLLEAEKHFLKAKSQQENEIYSDDFLYRINRVYGLLGQTADYKKERNQSVKISEVKIHGGGNFSSNDKLESSYFGSLGATFKFNQITYSSFEASGIEQITSWGKYDQDELHFSLNRYIKNGWSIHGAFHLGYLVSSFDFSSDRIGKIGYGNQFFRQTIDTIIKLNTSGGETTPIYLAYFDVSKRKGRLINSLNVSFQFQNKDYNLSSAYQIGTIGKTYVNNTLVDSTVIYTDSSYTENKSISKYTGVQFGLESAYFLPVLRDNFQLGVGAYGTFTNSGFEYFAKASVNTYLGTKVKLFYEFLYLKEVTIYSELKATLLMNTYEQISTTNRLGLDYSLNKRWKVTLGYTISKRKDFINSELYNFQTIFTGLTFNT